MDIHFGRRSIVARIATQDGVGPADAATQAMPGSPGGEFAPAEEKYALVGPIGAGGMGEVLLVQDRDLLRDVAMKVLRAEYAEHPAMKRKFLAEAQATSQLEHPGIPPVHDIGIAPDGKVYFTMKVVRGRTLTDVLKDVFVGCKETKAEYTVHKLMTVMERICEAVHFAHEKGVIHRDLKPDNIMLGEFGEVHVMDWGIAKVAATTDADDAAAADGIRTVETGDALMTQLGTVKGTIPYMSPEQAQGMSLDRRSDVYSLGAVLYEMLTLLPAYEGKGVALILKVRNNDFPSVETRNPRRAVPQDLASLCRRAMSKDPADRPATAHDLAVALRTFLDGRAEKERRHREAEALAAKGREAMGMYVAGKAEVAAAERAAEEQVARFQSWQALDEIRPMLDARRRVACLRREMALQFADATNLLNAALIADADNVVARTAFGDLWCGRLADAEQRRDPEEAAFALTMICRRDHDRLAAVAMGDGSLELESDPPGADVMVRRFEGDDGVLVPGEPRRLGTTPFDAVPLTMGIYLCVISLPGFRDVRYPVHITRNRAWKGRVRMRTDEEIGDGFVYVPGGPFVYGAGSDAKILELPDFAIAEKPVTFGDWAGFLAAVEKESGLEAATKLCPQISKGLLMERTPDGGWEVPADLRRSTSPRLAGSEMRWPVMSITWHDAVAYCEWKARTTGRSWRLPTEQEREKAARGVDGRTFPWGELAHASLAKCGDSREEVGHQPEPVGSFPTATSVYGMVDASGNVSDWTNSWADSRAVARVLRGGSWFSSVSGLRCASRSGSEPDFRMGGLRPARSLTP